MIDRRTALTYSVAAMVCFLSSCGNTKPKPIGPAPAEYRVRFQTTKGDFVILVHRTWAPIGADRFYELAKIGFFDGNYFFRAMRGFVVQFGLNGDPKINKDWSELAIRDDSPKVSNKIGTITFATSGINSRATQVFINLGDNSSLDVQGFSPFGEVIQGMENIERFYTGYGDGPPAGSGPSQAVIAELGTSYLEEHFPKLDLIKKARLEQAPPDAK